MHAFDAALALLVFAPVAAALLMEHIRATVLN